MSELIHCMSDVGQWTDSPRGLFCERPIRVGLGIGGWRLGVGGAGELWVGGVGAWGWGLGAWGFGLGGGIIYRGEGTIHCGYHIDTGSCSKPTIVAGKMLLKKYKI